MFNFLKKILNGKSDNDVRGNISYWSFQRFCKYYDYVIFNDHNFDNEVKIVMECVTTFKETDINKIAANANCMVKYCLFLLRYSKKKRWLDETYYINAHTNEIKKCSENDLNLIKKYYEMIYQKHYNIDEIVKEIHEEKNEIFKELKYLSNLSLLSGIKLDEETKELFYYTLDKKKKNERYVTINCPNCGALVDVLKYSSEKCSYCDTIVEDTYSRKDNE